MATSTVIRPPNKGWAGFFREAPGQHRSFTVSQADDGTLTPSQRRRLAALVASLQERKPLLKRQPKIERALPSGGRSYSAAEVGRMMQTDIRTAMIRRA